MLTELVNKKTEITDCLVKEYGVTPHEIIFMPLGADANTIVYKIVANDGEKYLLKLRTGNFDELSLQIQNLLIRSGIEHIIAPILIKDLATHCYNGQDYFTLYPFIDTLDQKAELFSDANKMILGRTLKQIHTLEISDVIKSRLKKYEVNLEWVIKLKKTVDRILNDEFVDPLAIEMQSYIGYKKKLIDKIINLAQELSTQLSFKPDEYILCHADLHFWNLLIDKNNYLYIIDWDTVLLAPKERDLMFIGSNIDKLWPTKDDIQLFYKGYGETNINELAIDYFRITRILEDLTISAIDVCYSNIGVKDKQRWLEYFKENFQIKNTIEAVLGNSY